MGGEILDLDQEKWTQAFRPVPLYNIESDHVLSAWVIPLKPIVIQGASVVAGK